MALHLLHASPAAAISFYDPRLGAVVVASHSPEWQIGDVIDINLEDYMKKPCGSGKQGPSYRGPSS